MSVGAATGRADGVAPDACGRTYESLADCVGPEVDRFWQRVWQRESAAYVRAEPQRFARLFSVSALDEILVERALRPADVELVRDGVGGAEHPAATPPLELDLDRVSAQVEHGHSLIVHWLERYWRPARDFARGLERDLGQSVSVHAVFTPEGGQALNPHYDQGDVFVLQIAGSKEWELYEPLIAFPLAGAGLSAGEAKPRTRLTLNAGDSLYMPRGAPHRAWTEASESLHLTILIGSYTWRDAFHDAIDACAAEDPRFRQLVEAVRTGSTSTTRVDELLETLRARLGPAEIEAREWDHFVAGAGAVRGGPLAQAQARHRLTLDTIVRPNPGAILRMAATDQGSSVVLLCDGKRHVLPAFAREAIEFCVTEAELTPRALPGLPSESSRLALVARLLREGVLVVPDATG